MPGGTRSRGVAMLAVKHGHASDDTSPRVEFFRRNQGQQSDAEGKQTMLGRKKGWIGIDLGTRTLKLAQVERSGAGLRIAASAVMRRPAAAGSEADNNTDDRERPARDVLAALAMSSGFSGRRVACVLPMRLTDLHMLAVPPGKAAERRAIVAHELSSMFVGDQQQRVFDFWDADPAPAAGSSAPTSVNVLSVPRRVISRVVGDLAKARLKCEALDGLPFTLARAVRLALPCQPAVPVGAIDWGVTSTTFCVVSAGRPLFTRHLRNCGFGRLAGAVSRTLGLSENDAIELLTKYGVPEPTCREDKQRDIQEMLAEVTAGCLQEISEEIKKTTSYLKMQYPAILPQRLCLFGSGATVKNIATPLSEKVRLPVDVWRLPGADTGSREDRRDPVELLGTAAALSVLAWES